MLQEIGNLGVMTLDINCIYDPNIIMTKETKKKLEEIKEQCVKNKVDINDKINELFNQNEKKTQEEKA